MKHPTLFTLLVLYLCVLPVAADIQIVTVSGAVLTHSHANNTLTIANPAQYGCTYPAGGTPVCSYTPIDVTSLTGTAPDESVFSVFNPGDPVVATSLGGAGGRWVAIAKLYGMAPDKSAIDIVGDPSKIPVPLAGNYGLELSQRPDCRTCTGIICTATSANVSIFDGKTLRSSGELPPKATSTYSGRGDGSGITVTFVRGQASSFYCPDSTLEPGSPLVSVYIVHVVPATGSVRQVTPTRSSAPSAIAPEVAMPADARPTPTRSGLLPAAAIGAVTLAAVLSAICRE